MALQPGRRLPLPAEDEAGRGQEGEKAGGRMSLDWSRIVTQAAAIVESYDTPVTLRQLFYRLASTQRLPNALTAYKTLSSTTAKARREGRFPDLSDRGRAIYRPACWQSPAEILCAVSRQYRRDRTEHQPCSLYLDVEKNGLVEQLTSWFGAYGVPVLALAGYSSQTYVDEVRKHAQGQHRPAVLIYGGDYDPSGEDIERDFLKRAGCFDEVVRVALTAAQVEEYHLPPQPGKRSDARAAGFMARHGRLVQVELDALDARDLHALYRLAFDRFWDVSAYEAVMEREADERAQLEDLREMVA